MGDNVVVVFEYTVGEPVIAHELPNIFMGVQFRGSGRQRQEGDVLGNVEIGRCMPPGLIDENYSVGTGADFTTDDGEMGVHCMCVAVRHDESGTLAFCGTDRAKNIGPLGSLIVRRTGSGSTFGPPSRDLVFLTYPGFVLPPELDFYAWGQTGPDLFHLGGKVFLNATIASPSCA